MGCALVVGFGLELFQLLPFSVIAVAVFCNNAIITLILGPFLLTLLEPRVSRWDLSWTELMDPEDRAPGTAPRLGLALAWLGAGGGFLLGLGLGLGVINAAGWPSLVVVLAPFVALLLLGCVLM
jgi:energy-coupling factor transport system substrate-specific component